MFENKFRNNFSRSATANNLYNLYDNQLLNKAENRLSHLAISGCCLLADL